ncbi:RxLR effector protein [Phytophthora megakarya]|uniref:RxLR effector protein n=1 Tax=Phytophthora megakarya TaxID=4795 RepID=A0A225WIH9_9STRA|nr:RxLR effector protein [Phytophthora megakarya]
MGLWQIVHSICIVLLLGINTYSSGAVAEAVSRSLRFSHCCSSTASSGFNINGRSSLRVNENDKTEKGPNDTYEERTSDIFSKLLRWLDKILGKNRQMRRWADLGKSNDFVKQKLKLNGLSGSALEQHRNYHLFENFIKITEAKTSTSDVWKNLGLEKIKTWEDLVKAVETENVQVFLRYANSFDDRAIRNVNKENKPVPVISDASWTEKMARMMSWLVNGKSEEYVMKALGFNTLSRVELDTNKNSEVFLVFWFVKNKNSLKSAKKETDVLLKKLLGLNNLLPGEIKRRRYETYVYLSELIKNRKLDEQLPTLMQWMTSRPGR